MIKLLNFALFQLTWFAAVLGASNGVLWPGVSALLLFLVVQRFISTHFRADIRLVAVAVIVGALAETALIQSGAIQYAAGQPLPQFAPVWLLVLWAAFALTMNTCLDWLQTRLTLAAVLGGIGGAVSYFAGIKLGAAQTGIPVALLLSTIAVIYAVATPLLLRVGHYFCQASE